MSQLDSHAHEHIVQLLQDTRGIDLGFAPHVIEAIRQQADTKQAYIYFLSIIDQISTNEALTSHQNRVLTINLDNRHDWTNLKSDDTINVTLTSPDSSGIIEAKFST